MLNYFSVLKQEKQYRRLFIAGLVNGIGDRFSQVAVLSLLLSLTGSGIAVGMTFAIRLIPYLVFGPIGGMLADRFSKKKIMVLTDIVRIFFALTPLLVRDASDIWLIYLSTFLLSVGEALYAPTRMSVIPQLVHKDRLLEVNGLEQTNVGFVLICGSVIGGVVAATVSINATFVINALSFLLSAMLLYGVKISSDDKALDHSPIEVSQSSRFYEIQMIFRKSAFLRAMVVALFLWPIGDGIFNVLISIYAVKVFQMGEVGIGLLYGALGVGLVLGSTLTSKVSTWMKMAAVMAVIFEGIFNMVISQTPYFWMIILFFIISAMCSAIGNACNETILMNAVPSHVRGRFFGLTTSIQNTLLGCTMLATGFLLNVIDPRVLGLLGGGIFVFVGMWILLVLYKSKSVELGG